MKDRKKVIMFVCGLLVTCFAVTCRAEVYAAMYCNHLDNGIRYTGKAYQDSRFADLHQRPMRLYGWILKRWEIREYYKMIGLELKYFDSARFESAERWCVVA